MKDHAFELIFREYNRMITAYLYGLVGDADEALDLTQETFVVAYRRIRDCDPSQSLAAWLRSIAWNQAANSLRRKRRHRDLLAEAGQVSRAFELFDRLEPDRPWEERLRALDDCMKRLPDAQRRAVDLFYRDGETGREIGTKLGVLENTVYQTMWQARKNLRGCIERRTGGSPKPLALQTNS